MGIEEILYPFAFYDNFLYIIDTAYSLYKK